MHIHIELSRNYRIYGIFMFCFSYMHDLNDLFVSAQVICIIKTENDDHNFNSMLTIILTHILKNN